MTWEKFEKRKPKPIKVRVEKKPQMRLVKSGGTKVLIGNIPCSKAFQGVDCVELYFNTGTKQIGLCPADGEGYKVSNPSVNNPCWRVACGAFVVKYGLVAGTCYSVHREDGGMIVLTPLQEDAE